MRIGLLGAGYMGSFHAAAFGAMDDVEIGGVAGRSPERAGELADRHGTAVFADVRALLDDASIEAVSVTTPTALHREHVIAALESGKHVFCETPLAQGVSDADAMLAAAAASGRVLQVALLMRFAHPCVRARDILLSGSLGEPLAVTTRRLAPGTTGEHHGDAIEELLLFDLDFLNWTLGMPRSVIASALTRPSGRIDHVFAALDYGGAQAYAEASYLMSLTHPFTATITGCSERGTVETRFVAPRDGPPTTRVTLHPEHGAPEADDDSGPDPYFAECRHFVDVVRGDAPPGLASAETARESLRIAAAVRESVATDARVGL